MKRLLGITTPSVAEGDQELSFFGGALDLSQPFDVGALTLTPLLEFGALQLNSDGDTEQGAGSLGLDFESTDENFTWVRPGLELAFRFDSATAWTLHPFLRASLVHYLGEDETTVEARLIGAPPAAGTMDISSGLGQDQWLFEAGLDFMTAKGYSAQLRFERTSADDFDVDQASLKIAIPF